MAARSIFIFCIQPRTLHCSAHCVHICCSVYSLVAGMEIWFVKTNRPPCGGCGALWREVASWDNKPRYTISIDVLNSRVSRNTNYSLSTVEHETSSCPLTFQTFVAGFSSKRSQRCWFAPAGNKRSMSHWWEKKWRQGRSRNTEAHSRPQYPTPTIALSALAKSQFDHAGSDQKLSITFSFKQPEHVNAVLDKVWPSYLS